MKKCPKCDTQYSDFDSYCMECGRKLVPIKPEVKKEFPVGELMALITQVGELETAVDDLRNAVDQVRHFELPEDITDISRHARTIEGFRKNLDENTRAVSEVGKSVRVAREALESENRKWKSEMEKSINTVFKEMKDDIQSLSKKDAMSLITKVGELETALDDLEDEIESLRHPEFPEDIVSIDDHEKAIGSLQKALSKTEEKAAKLREDFTAMNKNTKTVGTVVESLSKRLTARVDDIEKKVADAFQSARSGEEGLGRDISARIDSLEKEIDTLAQSQQKLELLELDKIKPKLVTEKAKEIPGMRSRLDNVSESVKFSRSELETLKGTVSSMSSELSRFLEEVKKNREGIREILSTKDSKETEKRISQMEKEVSQGVSEIKKSREQLKKMHMDSILHEMEELKRRIQLLEGRQANLQPLYEKIRKIEERVSTYTENIPTVIE